MNKEKNYSNILKAILLLCMLTLFTTRPVVAQQNDSDAREIVILGVNDIHSAVDMFPRFAGIVDSLRAIYPDLLLLAAGDLRTGNPVNDRYSEPGWPIIDLMNKLRFDASAIGNHEFDSKIPGMRGLMQKSNFPYLCANMDAPDSLRIPYVPYRFFERNGIRIGVLGLIQIGPSGIPDTYPDNVKGVSFRHYLDVVKNYKWMRDQCEVFVLLTHLGYDDDLLLAEAFPEADVIVGAHSHTEIPNRVMRNGVIITQTGKSLKYLTELKIEVSGGKVTAKTGYLISVKATTQNNRLIQAAVDKYTAETNLSGVLAVVATPFEKVGELGCLMADAQRAQTGTDISLQNFGGVRYETHPIGNFTEQDAVMLDPFNNELLVFELTGLQVEQAIVAMYDMGEDPYVSGITYTVLLDANKKAKKATVLMDNKPINPKQVYRVAINSYLGTMCPFLKPIKYVPTGINASDALVDYLMKQKTISYQGIQRITVKN